MTRSDLAKAIAHEIPDFSASDAEKVLKALPAVVKTELMARGEVHLPDIGKLHVKDVAARKSRNPANGAEIDIPAHKAVRFKAAKAIKVG